MEARRDAGDRDLDAAGFRQEMQELRREIREERRTDYAEFLEEMRTLVVDEEERTRAELTALFRGELNAAVSGQTRMLIIANATALFGVGGLAVAVAQLA